jgi:hypothetical protein
MKTQLVLVSLLLAASAQASGNFPGGIQDHLQTADLPRCNVCHQSAGGGDAVVAPFGVAMKGEGLAGGGDTAALVAALDALDDADTDSDGDGTGDIDELREGRDPNVDDGDGDGGDGGGGSDVAEPAGFGFGCSASSAPSVALVALLACGLRIRRRR